MGEKRVIEQIASDEIYNDDWFLKDSVLHDTTKVQPSVIKEYMNQGMATSQDVTDEATARQNMDNQLASGISKQMSNLADFYDTTKSYVVGDVVMQQSGDLLRCIAPTSGAFDITKWEPVTVDELFDDLNFSADAISYDNETSGLEAENVQDAIDETITKLSAVGSASGDIATFNDGSDLPMPKLEVSIEPVQEGSGDPSPTNIRPIIGWDEVNVGVSGVNVWDEEWEFASIDANTGIKGPYSNRIASKNYILCLPDTQYYIYSGSDYGQLRVCFYDADKRFISSRSQLTWNQPVTTPSGAEYMMFCNLNKDVTTYNNDISINYPSTDTSYHAYNGHTYTIDLDGTRYGGKVDLVSGVMTVDRVLKTLVGTETWTYTSTYNRVYTYISDAKKPSGAIVYSILSDKLHFSGGVMEDYGAYINNAGNLIVFAPSSITSDDQWKTWLASNNVQVVYELATPLTIQLTPTVVKSLRGKNNVFANTGAILDAEYIRDLTAIIDYILEQLGN